MFSANVIIKKKKNFRVKSDNEQENSIEFQWKWIVFKCSNFRCLSISIRVVAYANGGCVRSEYEAFTCDGIQSRCTSFLTDCSRNHWLTGSHDVVIQSGMKRLTIFEAVPAHNNNSPNWIIFIPFCRSQKIKIPVFFLFFFKLYLSYVNVC